MTINLIVRVWIMFMLVIVGLTVCMLVNGCASIKTSDCTRVDRGIWKCTGK